MRSLLLVLALALPQMARAGTVTISGISSGGFMASQMSTIYSDQFSGVATVAGGVYYCAQNHFQEKLTQYGTIAYFAFGVTANGVLTTLDPFNLSNAQNKDQAVEPLEINPIYQSVGVCMGHPDRAHGGENGPMNLDFMNKLEARGLIAPTVNISRQRVLIFQGRNDDVVRPEMADKLKEFYSRQGVPASSLKIITGEGNHNFPTDRDDGIGCDQEKVPYIANCQLDLAGDILQHTLGRSLRRGTLNPAHLKVVKQPGGPVSIASYGYLYANSFCMRFPERCDLHVALHGCKMSDDYDENFQKLYESKMQLSHILGVQDYELKMRTRRMGALTFAQKSGYAEYAEREENHLMIYFPQTRISTENYPANPKGCWDWYGWTGSEYATNQGVEAQWLMNQVRLVKQNPGALVIRNIKSAADQRFVYKWPQRPLHQARENQ